MVLHGEKVERTEVWLGNRGAKGRGIKPWPLLFLSLPLFTQGVRGETVWKIGGTGLDGVLLVAQSADKGASCLVFATHGTSEWSPFGFSKQLLRESYVNGGSGALA